MKPVVEYGKTALLTLLNHWHTVLSFYAVVLFGGGWLYMLAEAATEKAPSYQDSVWWAFITSTSVGYGDYFPVTEMGRLVGVGVAICGIWIVIPTIVVLMLQSVIQDMHKLTDLEQRLLIASANVTQEGLKIVLQENDVLFEQNRLIFKAISRLGVDADVVAEFEGLELPNRDYLVTLFEEVDNLEAEEEAETATNGH